MAIELNNENFETEVKSFDGVVLVDFWAPWCGPCQMLGPVIEEISKELADRDTVKVCKLNVDENAELASEYGVMSIPAIKFFKNGEVVDELVGLQQKDSLLEKINSIA
jgi:thioredoxin 1